MPPRSRASDVPSELTDKDPAHMTDNEPTDSGPTVTLAVGHPYDELALHDADGKATGVVITSAGTEVSAADEQNVRDAAKAAGVPIRKVR